MNIKKMLGRKANAIIKKSYWYNHVAFPGCRKFWQLNDFNLDVINLGSSNSYYGFDYNGIELKCANLALAPQYLLGDYEVLRNYSSYLKEGGTVILCNCLFSVFDGYDITYFDNRHYSILYPSSIFNFSIRKLKEVKNIQNNPIVYFPFWGLFQELKSFLKKNKDIPINQFEKDSERWMNIWAKEFSIDDFETDLSLRNEDLKKQAIEIVLKMKSFCDERNLRFVIVQPPISPVLRKKITKRMYSLYIEDFVKSQELKDIQFISYLDDEAFSDNSLYKNAYILNKKGAKKFSNRVLIDIGLISA